MADFTIKSGSYCPVCKGVTLCDHDHSMQELAERNFSHDVCSERDRLKAALQSRNDEVVRMREALTRTAASLVAAVSILSQADSQSKQPAMVVASNKMFAQMLTDYRAAIEHARQSLNPGT